jgi:hypothetical protein
MKTLKTPVTSCSAKKINLKYQTSWNLLDKSFDLSHTLKEKGRLTFIHGKLKLTVDLNGLNKD